MAVIINTNVDSIKIQGCLTSATNKMASTMERMSTGLKLNSAKDDAAGVMIASKMNVQLSGNKIAQNNVQNANAMLATAEGNIETIENNLARIRDLTLQAKNGTYSDKEIEAMQKEVEERVAEINRINTSAKYSDMKLFDQEGYKDGTKALKFQVGANKDDDNTITANAEIFKTINFTTITGFSAGEDIDAFKNKTLTVEEQKFNLSNMSAGDMATVLGKLDAGIENLSERKSYIGSAQNRLESALDTLTTQYENLSAARSIITDADIATEASNFTQQQILQQVSTSLLAQANQAPSIALSLV